MDVGIIKQVLVEDEHALKCVSGGCEDVDSVCLTSLLLSPSSSDLINPSPSLI